VAALTAIICCIGEARRLLFDRVPGQRRAAPRSLAALFSGYFRLDRGGGRAALGLAASAPILVQRAEVYEVAISCAYALTMLALGAVWLALHRPGQRGRWLAAASLAFGLAMGARPTALFGAGILILPLAAAWKAAGGAATSPACWRLPRSP